MARITIGMPVYNGAATIERAIAGLEAQTFGDFVVVASDNASTDSTPEVLAAWAARDHRVTVHHQAENLGTVGNFNYLITGAETDYFMWHACDDQMSPDYLERLCAVLDGDAGCGLAVGDIVKRDADGTEKRRVFPDLAGLSRLARVMTLLKRPRAPWIYGLFRSGELRAAYGRAVAFGDLLKRAELAPHCADVVLRRRQPLSLGNFLDQQNALDRPFRLRADRGP